MSYNVKKNINLLSSAPSINYNTSHNNASLAVATMCCDVDAKYWRR